MKKAISIFMILVAFLIIYFLQANFFSWFNLAGIKPNLFVILILFLGLFAGGKIGISSGIVTGLLLDIKKKKNNRNFSCYVWNCWIFRRIFWQDIFQRKQNNHYANGYGLYYFAWNGTLLIKYYDRICCIWNMEFY